MNGSLRVYDAYGQANGSAHGVRSGFAGEATEVGTGWYLLGTRAYHPVQRRFLMPDQTSPFEKGGLNRYAYGGGDPINRIDPSGEAWTDWLVAGLTLTFAVVGTIASAGALASTVVAAGGLVAAMATPGIVATTAAAVSDVVALSATIGSVATMGTKDHKANSIFGWVSMSAGIASGVGTATAIKQGANLGRHFDDPVSLSGWRARSSSIDESGAPFANGGGSARNSTTSSISLAPTVRKTLSATNESVSQATTRTVALPGRDIEPAALRRLVRGMGDRNEREATIYVGAATAQRRSLPAKAQRNARAKPDLPSHNLQRASVIAGAAGVDLRVVDMSRQTFQSRRIARAEDGQPVSAGGLGMADATILNALNMRSDISPSQPSTRASI